MADKTENNENNENALAAPEDQGPERFLGMQTVDGRPVTSETKPTANPSRSAKSAKPDTDSDEEADDGDHDEDDDHDEGQPQRHKSAQSRINKAVAKQRSAERRASAAESKVATLDARLAALEARSTQGADTPPAKKDGPPAPDDYEYGELDKEYIKDTSQYWARQAVAAEQATSKKAATTKQQLAEQAEWSKKIDEFLSRGLELFEDFDSVVQDEGLKISQSLAELAMESEYGPEIMYAVGDDPKESRLVSGMSPAKQAAWFGRKEAELSSRSPDADEVDDEDEDDDLPTTPKVTKAPRPPKKNRGNGESQAVSANTSDFAAFERMATATK